jgi:replicative DNA helicase
VLLDPDVLVDLDWLAADHFASAGARAAFSAIRNLEASGSPIDFVTVFERMQKSGDGAVDKAEEFLGDCLRNVPDATRASVYAAKVRDESINRKVRVELERLANSNTSSGVELISMAMAALAGLDCGILESTPSINDLVRRRMKQLEQIGLDRAAGIRSMTGYPTGVEKLDGLTGGWQSKIVSIVCARPAMGKSSFGLATADACTAANFGVHLFSLEDTEEAYADRTVSRGSNVPAEKIRSADLNRGEMSDLAMAMQKLGKRKWLIDSRSGIGADEIVRSVRKHRRANDTRVVIVDYVQLLKSSRDVSRHEQLTESITVLADAAKLDGLAYVVMSQLNRDVEKRTDKRPQLADLRESGSLEERAKCVVGLYRGHYYTPGRPTKGVDYDDNESPPGPKEFAEQVQLLVLKNNNGSTGSVHARFHGPTTRME